MVSGDTASTVLEFHYFFSLGMSSDCHTVQMSNKINISNILSTEADLMLSSKQVVIIWDAIYYVFEVQTGLTQLMTLL